ncbi:MAG: hypothetical protein K2X01_08655 [Cyanobacteria bacterium]|nr:hypothetical protein [Cyanobacteriota bacterium]
MKQQKPLGGYFETEETALLPPTQSPNPLIFQNAVTFTSGRAALLAILENLPPCQLYMPLYCCGVLQEALAPSPHIQPCYYRLKAKPGSFLLEPELPPDLPSDVRVLYVNYAGLQGTVVSTLLEQFGTRLILDNTHAFFETPPTGCFGFNSARKFFGVPDGALAYGLNSSQYSAFRPNNSLVTDEHLTLKAMGDDQAGYEIYARHEQQMSQSCRTDWAMSVYTLKILERINTDWVKARRRENYQYLRTAIASLKDTQPGLDNEWHLPVVLPIDTIPFAYPFYPKQAVENPLFSSQLRQYLRDQQIYTPTLWPEVLDTSGEELEAQSVEAKLSRDTLWLPLDHRYTPEDLTRLIAVLETSGAK